MLPVVGGLISQSISTNNHATPGLPYSSLFLEVSLFTCAKLASVHPEQAAYVLQSWREESTVLLGLQHRKNLTV